jgi:hypothetical protein
MTDFPWSAVLGIAGIVGTLVAVHLSNSAAEQRQRLAQQHDDHTRFNKERIEIYARFLRASRMCRDAAYKSAGFMLRNHGAAIPQSEQIAILERYHNSWAELTEASEMVSLVASRPIKEVADRVTELARAIVVPDPDQTAMQLNERNSELAALEEAFRAAARSELLPEGGNRERYRSL